MYIYIYTYIAKDQQQQIYPCYTCNRCKHLFKLTFASHHLLMNYRIDGLTLDTDTFFFLKCTQNNNAKKTTRRNEWFIGHQGRHTFDGDSSIVLAGLSVGVVAIVVVVVVVVVVVASDFIDSQSLELLDDIGLQSASSSNVVDEL